MNYTNKLDIEALKADEEAFRGLIGNVPSGYGKTFQPTGLDGDSWTFFKSTEEDSYLLQRKSSSEVLDIIGYGKLIGFTIQDLKQKYPQYVICESVADNLELWLSSHGLSQEELVAHGWEVAETELKYPIQTNEGIKYQSRRLGAGHKQRFYSYKGLKTGLYFYSPAALRNTNKLIICAGASDCLNTHLAFGGEVDCVGVLGEGNIPAELLNVSKNYEEIIVAYDSDETGIESSKKLAAKLGKAKIVDWALFDGIKDLSELASKKGREAIVQIIDLSMQPVSISSSEEWEELKPWPNPLKSVMKFDLDFLPQKLQPFISDVAERLQCPIDFPAAALIVVLSSALGRRLGIKPKQRDNWIVIPNLWGMVIGRPSIMKTPAMKQPMNLLEYHENNRFKEHQEKQSKYDQNKVVYEAIEQERKSQIKQAVKTGQDAFAIAEQELELPPVPKMKRLITNDATIEKLGELLSENEYGLLYFRDELHGFIASFEKEGREADRAFYLEGWNGDGRHTVDRIGRGSIFIEAICVSILGGIQPGKLQSLVKQAVSGGTGDDGLLQRFQVAVWPDDIGEWKNVDRFPNTQAREKVREVVHSFLQLEHGHTPAKKDKFNPVHFLPLDQGAQLLFNEWLFEHENSIRQNSTHQSIEAHFGKYRSLVPSLALIFQLTEELNSSEVGRLALSRALAYSEYLKTHAIRIYESTTLGEIQAGQSLLRKISSKELQAPFTAREVQRKGWSGLNTPEMTKSVLDLLEDLNYIKGVQSHHCGRPTTLYSINPKLEVNESE